MNKTLYYVAEAIAEIKSIDIEKAIDIVNKSTFPELLAEMPDFVQHYDAEYWAHEIIEGMN